MASVEDCTVMGATGELFRNPNPGSQQAQCPALHSSERGHMSASEMSKRLSMALCIPPSSSLQGHAYPVTSYSPLLPGMGNKDVSNLGIRGCHIQVNYCVNEHANTDFGKI